MYLLLDIGNTRAKAAFTDGKDYWEYISYSDDIPYAMKRPEVQAALWLATGEEPLWLDEFKTFPQVQQLTYQTPIPLTVAYQSPATLGADRIAAACGAYAHFPKKPLLLIDAGTALTCDFISPEGRFQGGAISPGLAMRSEALHRYTARLPLVTLTSLPPLTGTSTELSIASGILYGLIGEIQFRIDRYSEQYPELVVILSGGDAALFESHLKGYIFARPNLVFEGLLEVLLHNAHS